MECLYTQHLFINSVHREQGTPYHYGIVVPADGVQCEDDEVLAISLLRFSAYRDWAGIPANDNTVTFTTSAGSQSVYISPGNPTNSQIALQLANNTLSISVTYDTPSNTLIFTCPNSMQLTCTPTLGTTLGFPTGTSASSTLLQSATLRPPQLDQVVLHLEGIAPYADRPNMESAFGMMRPSTMLCAFAADGGPYTHIKYENACEEFELMVENRQLNVLWFLLTDFLGNPLTYLGDHTIVLRIRTLKTKTTEGIELQQEMVGLLKDQLMQQTLGL